jgi:tRNA-2-methylthio-N6-dimethylallyladenosine synthase
VVNFDGHPDLIGQFVDIRITNAQPNSLRGEIVAYHDSAAGSGTQQRAS